MSNLPYQEPAGWPIHNWGGDVYARDDKQESQNIEKEQRIEMSPPPHPPARYQHKTKLLAADPSTLCHTLWMKIYVPHWLRHQIKRWDGDSLVSVCR